MTVTDGQIHLWGIEPVTTPWPGALQHTPLSAEEVIATLDANGVARAVLVPPSTAPSNTERAIEAARQHPDRFAAMAIVDVDLENRPRVRSYLQDPHVLGLRFNFRVNPEWLSDGTAEWVWETAEEFDAPIMMFAPGQAAAVGEIARRHPRLRVIVDHLGLSIDVRDGAIAQFVDAVIALSAQPNVAVKISALPCYVSDPWPFHTLDAHVRRALDAFGPERCIWGSDFSHLPCSYAEWLDYMRYRIDYLADDDMDWLMGKSAEKWLGWPDAS